MGNRMAQQKIDATKLPSSFTGDGKEDVSAWLQRIELCFSAQQTNMLDNQQAICLALNMSGIAAKWFYNIRGTYLWSNSNSK